MYDYIFISSCFLVIIACYVWAKIEKVVKGRGEQE